MKPFLFLLGVFAISCSSPRYTYYFNDQTALATAESSPLNLPPDALTANMERSVTEGPAPKRTISLPTPTADVSSEKPADRSQKREAKEIKREVTRELKSAIRDFKKNRKTSTTSPSSVEQRTTNPKNNGFAIAGFVLGILGWFVLWPLVIVGIIFSAIGMNSERRGLATAGLIIGVVGIVLILIAAQQGNLA